MRASRTRRLAFPITTFALTLLLFTVVPTAVGAAYPPGTVVSTYVDARYCGDGHVSVVADSGGNLVDACTTSGARSGPAVAGTAPYAPPGYTPAVPGGAPYAPPGYNPTAPGAAPYTIPPTTPGTGYVPTFNNGYVPPVTGYLPPVNGSNGITGTVVRQYTDNNSYCPNGDVTQTTSGFYCTANGAPAAATGSAPVYNSGYAPPFTNGYALVANNGYAPGASGYSGGVTGTVVRQYTDNNSNCPNGDVTQTTSGFYCTANGAPASVLGYTPTYNGGYAPNAGYAPVLNTGHGPSPSGYTGTTGTVLRQYNDGRSNCPNGDVTQTTAGFFCTANGVPAMRTG